MTGGRIPPHRQCRPYTSPVIDRQQRRSPERCENAPIWTAVARSVQAPTLFGGHHDAQHLAEILAQRYQHALPMTKATPKSP